MGEPFLVNGEEIMRPGEGSVKNTVNCRCRMITIPDEGAVPITEISDIGVGIGESRIPSFSLETITNTVVQTIATAGNALVEGVATTLNQFRTQIKETFEEVGLKVKKLQLSSKRSLKEYNEIQSEIKSLMKKYNYATYHNDAEIDLVFRSGTQFLGRVSTVIRTGKTAKVNLGSPFDIRNSRVRMLDSNMIGKFDRRYNSHVDLDKQYLSTTVHEMAHLLTTELTANKEFLMSLGTPGKRFWFELNKIRDRYSKELIALREADNSVIFNNIFLGQYASTNADEFFAEAFTEYHLSSSPSKYAVEVGQLIEKYYGK